MRDSALVFATGARLAALPVAHVRETMRPLPTEPLAGALPFIDGVSVIRGEAVPVLNVAAFLSPGSRDVATRFITVRVGERCVALSVAAVLGIRPAEALDIGALQPLLTDAVGAAVEAIGKLDGQLLFVLRAASLVPPETWAGLNPIETAR
jgi:purine-binding chemotaxis protein CheW